MLPAIFSCCWVRVSLCSSGQPRPQICLPPQYQDYGTSISFLNRFHEVKAGFEPLILLPFTSVHYFSDKKKKKITQYIVTHNVHLTEVLTYFLPTYNLNNFVFIICISLHPYPLNRIYMRTWSFYQLLPWYFDLFYCFWLRI